MNPIAVWDVHDPGWLDNRAAKTAWLEGQGLPVDDMWRVEFLLVDAPAARIYCYKRNAEGRRYLDGHSQEPHDHDACMPASEPPRVVSLSGLPPRELLGTAA